MRIGDLQGIPLFAGLAPEDRARAAAVARRLEWEVGHVVVNEGEFAFDFYAIKQGAVEVRRGARRVAVLGDGDFFGELGVVPYDAPAGRDAELLPWSSPQRPRRLRSLGATFAR